MSTKLSGTQNSTIFFKCAKTLLSLHYRICIYHTNIQVRIEVEITARRCLSYLSGGHIVAILKDILYEEEKERVSPRYRLAFIRIGEASKHFKPKEKGILLDVLRQSGFSKDDLRERGWTFSTNLWNSSSYLSQSLNALPPLVTMGTKKSRQKLQHVMTETSFRRHRR